MLRFVAMGSFRTTSRWTTVSGRDAQWPPALFNLYACLVVERWKEKVKDVEGVGISLNYKLDEKLFRRYTKNAKQARLTEGQFADDAALLATTHSGAETAMSEFASTVSDFGRNVSCWTGDNRRRPVPLKCRPGDD